MNIDLFYGLIKDKYGIILEKDIRIMEMTSALEVAKHLGLEISVEHEFTLAHTITIPYSEYRRILDGRG